MTQETQTQDIPILANWIGGERRASPDGQSFPVYNPSTEEMLAQTPDSPPTVVDEAVAVATDAFASWSRMAIPKRTGIFFRYKELLEAHFAEIAGLITRENGKTLSEAQGDLRRGIEVVEFACAASTTLKGETLPLISEAMDGASTREPLGVCAGITPFNFPAMVPMWMFPLAIVAGNTFILKPSEKVPLTALRLAELASEAGLPDGVLNVVLGGRPVVERICTHPGISAVSFVGSTAVAEQVYQLGTRHGKRVQAAGGAKNVMVVMPDANPDSTIRAILGASYGCAGQRCMAGSIVLGVGNAADPLARRLGDAIDAMKLLPTDSHPESDMGPVISGEAQSRLRDAIGRAAQNGVPMVRDGRVKVPSKGFFVGPTLFDHVTPEMEVAQSELFGPVLSMGRPEDLSQAIDWIRQSGYGNGAVLFTQDGGLARTFAREVPCGMVGINVGVPAPMAVFAFSGWNRSFFGDLHVQGMEGLLFYTRQKVVFSRWDDQYTRTLGW